MNNIYQKTGRVVLGALFAAGCTAWLYRPVHATPPAGPDYWPLKVGNMWTIGGTFNGRDMTQVVTVTKVERQGSAVLATLDYKLSGQSINMEVYRVSAQAVERMTSGPNGSVKLDPPLPVIRYPLADGKSWTWSGVIITAGQKVQGSSKLSVAGPMTVKTPAGTFKAMRVHSALTVEAQGQKVSIPNDYWFVANVGMVQQSAVLGGQTVVGKLTKYKLK
jgi:hypothetical protein